MYSENEQDSVSLVSTADIETIYTPTSQSTDEFELLDRPDHLASLDDACSSESTSVPPSVYAHEYEQGRRYHRYKSGRYPLPNDVVEQHVEDIKHALMLELTEGNLFYSDIDEYPQKIIDIGTGTGTWAIDAADTYPSASVIGTDLSPIQPRWLPVNARMFVEDCEEPEWVHGPGFDLVHFRGIADVLRDLTSMVANAYKVGGWIEFQEFGTHILCDDGSMKPNDPLQAFAELSAKGMRKLGCASYGRQDVQGALEHVGFAKVQVVTKKIPISSWPREKKMRMLGIFMKTIILESLDSYAAKPLTALGMSSDERKELIDRVQASLEDNSIHRYLLCHFIYGQKEEVVSDSESYFE